MAYSEKMQRCHEYVEALEEEKKKIMVFQRELPLCLELVTQAIEACKKELSGTATEFMHGQSEFSEQTNSSEGTRPVVLEEFMPIKRTISSSDYDDDDEEHHSHKPSSKEKLSDLKKKSDWLRSVQLWNNQSPDPPSGEAVPGKAAVTEVKRNGGAFQPFHKEKSSTPAKSNQIVAKIPASSTSSTAETVTGSGSSGGGGSNKKSEDKKQRRCWSPELHRRFLHALQQLGGSHATPKQIRELMKVDGLTNDEVKSHLQKYRLHTRRPNPAIHNNNNPQAPQFVVVGGIWVPPPEYPTAGEAVPPPTTTGIYAPVAAPPVPAVSKSVKKQSEEGRGKYSEGRVRSNSPANSSSTHITTNSPVF